MSYGDLLILNLCSKKQDHMMYAYSGMECDGHNFLLFEVIFCPFPPLLTPKIKIWKKCKKYLLHMCIITQDHIMYCSWDIKYKRQFFVILGHFCTLSLLTTQKTKLLKKLKKQLKMLSLYTCVPQMIIIWCMVPEISSTTDRISCHFGLFFALLPP